jgi:hypothetical protein
VDTLLVYDTAVLPFVESALSGSDMSASAQVSLVRLSGYLANGAAQKVLLPHLRHPHRELRMALLAALQRTGYRAVEEKDIKQIEVALQAEVERTAVILAASTTIGQSPEFSPLQAAFQTDRQQSIQRILLLFSFLYDPLTLRRVGDTLQLSSGAERAQAVETVDLICSAPHKQLLLPLIDNELSDTQRLSALEKRVSLPAATAEEWLLKIISESGDQFDDWTQACAIYGAVSTNRSVWRAPIRQAMQDNLGDGKRPFALETAQWAIEQPAGGQEMLTIEKVSFLKGTALFENVPDAVLASVAQVAEVVELPAHKQFINEGELAGEMYIIVEGAVRVQKKERQIAEMKAGEVVGELAIFDREPRSADVVTIMPTVLLQLDRETLREVMADRPEISNGIIQTLSQRIREQGALMAKLKGNA